MRRGGRARLRSGPEGLEVGEGEVGEGCEGEVSGGEGIDRVGGGDGDGFAIGGEGGFDACVGVFDDDAEMGVDADGGGGVEEDVGRGFAVLDVGGGGDGVEERGEACQFHDEIDIGAVGGGTDGAGDVGVAEGGEERADAGERFDAGGADGVAVEGFLAEPEGRDGGGVAGGGPWCEVRDDAVVAHAEGGFEEAGREWLAEFGGEEVPCGFVSGVGVDDDAVPVEEDAEGWGGGHVRRSGACGGRRGYRP